MTITHDDDDKLAQLQLARNNAINAYQRACSPAWDDPPLEPDDAAILLYRITEADAAYIAALLTRIRELEAANAAAELEAVLRWLQKKRTFIHEQADTFKGDMESLWNSGLLSELATCDEWYAEVADALQAARSHEDEDAPTQEGSE